MKRVPAALVALTAGAALLLACCQNPFVPKITAIKALAASPVIGISAEGGSAIANGGSFAYGELSIADKKDQSFVVTNSGKSALSIPAASVTIAGADSSCFALASALPESVPPGGSASFSIRFTPGTVGAKSASLGFSTNDVSNPAFSFGLSGTGISQAPTPVIEGGDVQCYPSGLATVTINCSSSSATIYYSTDGSVPSLSMLGTSTLKYSSPFVFSFVAKGSGSVRAMATISGMSDSIVATAYFTTTLTVAPSINVSAQTFLSGDSLPAFVVTSSTDNASIAFTINGSAPSPSDAKLLNIEDKAKASDTTTTYIAANKSSFYYVGPHTGGSFTLKVVAFVPKDSGYLCSDIATASYGFKMATPAWAGVLPSSDYYTSAQSITVSCVNGSGGTGTMTYSTSGTVVTPSTTYTSAIAVPVGAEGSSTEETIKVIAHQTDWIDSDALQGTFNVCGPGKWDSSKWDQATWQ
jgi:hypothetical protein